MSSKYTNLHHVRIAQTACYALQDRIAGRSQSDWYQNLRGNYQALSWSTCDSLHVQFELIGDVLHALRDVRKSQQIPEILKPYVMYVAFMKFEQYQQEAT